MALTLNTTSLNLVKSEVDTTLTQVEGHLGSFVEERDNVAPLTLCVEGLEQIHGALRLVELHGAIELSEAMYALMREAQGTGAKTPDESFAALGGAIMVLSRYLEYVQIKGGCWPQLLIPTINQVHAALKRPPLREGSFIPLPASLPVPPSLAPVEIAPAQWQPLVRRIRLMYQIGLIAVLRDQADSPHFRMMARAVERARQLTQGQPVAVLWWVAGAAVEALQQGVAANLVRKSVLGQLDRQLKTLQTEGSSPALDTALLADTLYIAGLADGGTQVDAVRSAFHLGDYSLTQKTLTQEYEIMCGPGGSVFKTVASVLKDELAHVKDSLDMIARGAQTGGEGFGAVADSLHKTSQTLVMLGLVDVSRLMREQADLARRWGPEPGNDALHALVDVLMEVENAVSTLVRQVTPGVDTPINNARISVHQLDEARALLIAETRSGLSLAKRAISSYLESDRDVMHLNNVPATLQSVAGGLSFLIIERGAEVLRVCGQYIEQRMLNADNQPPMADLEDLADAISSVDYFLESLEANKPISEDILDIAEDSMESLGYPVPKRKAA